MGNSAKAESNYATIAGGFRSRANSRFASVMGGSKNTAAGRFSTVGGFNGKSTGDYSVGFSSTGSACTVRGDSSLGMCADSVQLRDSSGNW